MKIYLAGPWAQRDAMRKAREKIHITSSHVVYSRWLDLVVTNKPGEQAMEAQHDIEDLNEASALVVMNLEKSEGKAFEQGYMFGQHKPVIVVGAKTHVFQYHPNITVVDTLDDALLVLDRLQ